jgi:hypothetical protein
MDEQAAADAFKRFGDQSGLAALIEEYIWIAVVGFALLFLRDAINNLLAGLALSVGSDYSESDTVWLQTNGTRRPARIANLGLFSTTFYLYDIEEINGEPHHHRRHADEVTQRTAAIITHRATTRSTAPWRDAMTKNHQRPDRRIPAVAAGGR